MSTLIERSFSGGEISPSVQARIDNSKVASGLKTCRNFLVMRNGGVSNRAGTKLVGEVTPYAVLPSIRLIPFVVDSSNAYILEFRTKVGNVSDMRVIKNGAYVSVSTAHISGVTLGTTTIVTTGAAHGFSVGDEIFLNGILGTIELNFRDIIITVVTATTFSFTLDSRTFGAFQLDGALQGATATKIYTTPTPIPMDLGQSHLVKYAQTANSMVFTCGTVSGFTVLVPTELVRVSDTSWTFTAMTFAPVQATVTNQVITGNVNPAADTITYRYCVTAVNDITGEESLPTTPGSTGVVTAVSPGSGYPNFVNFTIATGCTFYNIYRETYDTSGVYGLLAVVKSTSLPFTDNGSINPSTVKTAPESRNPFTPTATNSPSAVCYSQQRLMFGNSPTYPERIWGSRSGLKNNFTITKNALDDEAIDSDIIGNQVNKIQNMINVGKLIVLTSGTELTIEGNLSGIMTPAAMNPKEQTQNGSSYVPPVLVGGNALYVQERGSIVRDLTFEFQTDGYKGNDLTVFASHLFEGYTIVEWAWQAIPNSIIWAVRSDGTLIALTYIREQQIWAWHRHDTDGLVKHVAVIPEGTEHSVYIEVVRTINSADRHFVERMNTRIVSEATIKDSVFSDSTITYDGRNTNTSFTCQLLNSATITETGTGATVVVNSPSWLSNVNLLLRINGNPWPVGMIAKIFDVFKITMSNGTVITLTVKNVSVANNDWVVTPDIDIPVTAQGPTFTTWAGCKNNFTGLWHLEGKSVSVLGDGFVDASPNNSEYVTATVTSGKISLTDYYSVIQVGLPYTSDLETLNIDTAQGETAIDKAKSIGRVTLSMEKTRGGFVGPAIPTGTDPLDGLFELKIRNDELYQDPTALLTDYADVNLRTEWNSNGRILIRQTEPLPISILALAPGGFLPIK